MTMIERVSAAICDKRCELIAQPLSRIYDQLAKAAIKAMREFTDEMFDASDSRLVRAELEQN